MMLFRIYLILNDARVKPDKNFFSFIPGSKSISFKELQRVISSLNGVKTDFEYCNKYNADLDCYYVFENKETGELIRFEINYGNKKTSANLTRISVDTKPSVPSKQTRRFVVRFVKKILSKIPMQVYFVDSGRVISLKDLKGKIDAPDESAENLKKLREKDEVEKSEEAYKKIKELENKNKSKNARPKK